MDAGPSAPNSTVRKADGGVGAAAVTAPSTNKDSPLRRLRRENHLLRLQLLKLREQQRSLVLQVAAAGLRCESCDGAQPTVTSAETTQALRTPAAALPCVASPSPPAARDGEDDEAVALRARMLQRREARHQRTTSARALLPGVEQLSEGDPAGPDDESVATTATAAAHSDISDEPGQSPLGAGGAALVNGAAASQAASTPPPMLTTTRDSTAAAEDDMSAQAMLQRFHNRKAQRRLRLEQMLSNADEGALNSTPFGNAPRRVAGAAEEASASRLNSNNSSMATSGGALDGDGAAEEGLSASAEGAVGHRTARGGEAAGATSAAAAAPTAGPTQNPNQIGRVVSDATKNNSWYLCKVLEVALLDTIQARHGGDAVTPAQTPTHAAASTLPTSPAPSTRNGGDEPATTTSAAVSPSSAAAPQFLYQVGVSDNALRRAIEESLVLPFRCIRDAPQRLTSQQAADEAVPPFEVENKDAELRRCFAGHGMRDSAERTARAEAAAGAADGTGDDEGGVNAPPVLGADDDNLDPFARLLLARLSAELPSSNAKGDKKGKEHRSNAKQREEFLQGLYTGGAEGGASAGTSFAKGGGLPSSSSSSAKPNAAFVMAAAGGDGKMHIPKKHFSRLDEVQVEMHAPVIFNQIRGFLRLDVDRFRRSFVQSAARVEAGEGGGDGAVPDAPRVRLSHQQQQQQQQQRRLRGAGTVGGAAEEATSWRISVSPGKSGTTLLYFGDYVMKTVRPSEMEFFVRKFLPAYVRYCERNPHTLLPRFYALVTVRWWKAGMAQHFVLMHNVFATPYYIHRIYDVKGSTVNRTALQPGKPPPRTAFGALLLKDNDLPTQLIICGPYQRAILLAQFRSDVGFLRQLSIVDYSCMIGVRSRLFSREEGPSKTIVLQRHQHHNSGAPYVDPLVGGEAPMRHSRTHSEITNVTSAAAEAGEQTVSVAISGAGLAGPAPGTRPVSDDDVYVCIHGCDGGLLSLPIYAPGDDTTAREDVYYLGIIDVLQTYNSAKKLESFAKGFVNDRQAISVIPPDGYSERLYKVLERITM